MKGCCVRLALTLVGFLAATSVAAAETAAETVHKWGLIGPWSRDCSRQSDRNSDTLLAYEIVKDGRVVFQRGFGDATEESEVVTAEVSEDGILNLRLFFPALNRTLESGLRMQSDGSMRAIYTRTLQGEYTIRDGKILRQR